MAGEGKVELLQRGVVVGFQDEGGRHGGRGSDYQVTPKDVDEKIQRHDSELKWKRAESKVKFSAGAPTPVTGAALQQSTY